jgi:branched-chain amino acid transport system permease protein
MVQRSPRRWSGVDVVRYKVAIFVLSAVFASLMGSVTAHYVGFVTPNLADFFHSIELVTMVVIGGMASVYGSLVGAVLLTACRRRWPPSKAGKRWPSAPS